VKRLSASKLSSYAFCPRRFYLRYIKGIEEPANDLMRRGLAIHEMIAQLIDGELPDIDRVINKHFNVSPDENTYRHILSTVKLVKKEILDVTEFEGAEIHFEKELEGFTFVGIIDAITKDGRIIDWKAVDKLKDYRDPMQLSVYDKAFPDKELMYIQVTPDELVRVDYTKPEINSGWLKVLSLLPKIEKEQYPMRRTTYCERCFYRNMCRDAMKK